MHTHSQILLVGRDPMLLQTRKLILGTYFEVESAGRISEARAILSQHDVDLIVLCDTLSRNERLQIADMVHDKKPQPTLLSLLGPGTRDVNNCIGRKLQNFGGPLQLLRECADVLGCNLGKQKAFMA